MGLYLRGGGVVRDGGSQRVSVVAWFLRFILTIDYCIEMVCWCMPVTTLYFDVGKIMSIEKSSSPGGVT